MPKIDTVFILGAGFSRAIGKCKINNLEFQAPLDKDFFFILEKNNILKDLLSDKPCLKYMLDWMGIYDKAAATLKQNGYSLERFWSNLEIMFKVKSSISGFPDFYLLGGPTKVNLEPIPNIDEWKKEMSEEGKVRYDFLSRQGNFFETETLILHFAVYELKKIIFQVFSALSYPDNSLVIGFKQIVGEAPLISFNYDCLLENIFKNHCIFNYDERGNLSDKNNLIIKPHGSLGWIVKKKYSLDQENKRGTIELLSREIKRDINKEVFTFNRNTSEAIEPIIIPMAPGKENYIAGLDATRIEYCPPNETNKKREFIDCVMSYGKMLEMIRESKRVVFIGYSFPQMDYETILLLNLALKYSNVVECHICTKDGGIHNPDIPCNKVIHYKDGLEQFVNEVKQ